MSYIQSLIDNNLKSLTDMLKVALESQKITTEDIQNALIAEAKPVPAGGDIYKITDISNKLLARIQQTPDRDMLIIVKKILRSTKYAAVTWYSVTGMDNNPHALPITPFNSQGSEQVNDRNPAHNESQTSAL